MITKVYNLLRRLLLVALFLFLACHVLVYWLKREKDHRLDNSLEYLMSNVLHARSWHSIQRVSGESITDASAQWMVSSDLELMKTLKSNGNFASADDSDVEYIRHEKEQNFGISADPDNPTIVFRSKIGLGSSSICSTLPCSIYLMPLENHTIYVFISKI